eukprot:CAMPEP_0174277632 /NCGR_PEP_ID=MMETSP0439-20130205/61037_1 /TAXON_ID=0 /ORGANISM="Stereomyxa ramosa, Strain Chinc5" /LENGTH=891 /DNA_ID=CAMNT_0015369969 /DNA_START=12 /DNA_END=2687 /DNA_ORIENTATION=+
MSSGDGEGFMTTSKRVLTRQLRDSWVVTELGRLSGEGRTIRYMLCGVFCVLLVIAFLLLATLGMTIAALSIYNTPSSDEQTTIYGGDSYYLTDADGNILSTNSAEYTEVSSLEELNGDFSGLRKISFLTADAAYDFKVMGFKYEKNEWRFQMVNDHEIVMDKSGNIVYLLQSDEILVTAADIDSFSSTFEVDENGARNEERGYGGYGGYGGYTNGGGGYSSGYLYGDDFTFIGCSQDDNAHDACFDAEEEDVVRYVLVLQNDWRDISGVEHDVITINDSFTGPTIYAKKGQTLEITVYNGLRSQATSIHWHGILHRNGQNAADGAWGITQYSIGLGETFVYRWKVEQVGTYFYHSHVNSQRADGIVGSLILEESEPEDSDTFEDVILEEGQELAGQDMVFLLHEEYHVNQITKGSAPFVAPPFSLEYKIETILVNGKGRADCDNLGIFSNRERCTANILARNEVSDDPKTSRLNVTRRDNPGLYRARIIHGGSRHFYRWTLRDSDGNVVPGTIIATQGTPLKQLGNIEFITLAPGYRYDVLYDLPEGNYIVQLWESGDGNQRDNGPQWGVEEFDFRGYNLSCPNDFRYRGAQGLAVVTIGPSESVAEPVVDPISPHTIIETEDNVLSSNDRRLEETKNDVPGDDEVDFEIYLDTYFDGTQWKIIPSTTGNLNQVQIIAPPFPDPNVPGVAWLEQNPVPPLLQYYIAEQEFPDFGGINIVINGRRQPVVDIYWNVLTLEHPIHLHGHKVWFLASAGTPPDRDAQKNLSKAIKLDTWFSSDERPQRPVSPAPVMFGGCNWAAAPGNFPVGFSVVRVRFDNPGLWLSHCHMDQHNEGGFRLLFTVDTYRFVKRQFQRVTLGCTRRVGDWVKYRWFNYPQRTANKFPYPFHIDSV